MTNFIMYYGKKTIPFMYLLTQILIILMLNIALIINNAHYALSSLTTIVYFIIAFSNPGFIVYESFQQPQPACSEPVIPTFQVSPRALMDQIVVNQLGIQSYLQDKSNKKDNQVKIQAEQPFKVLSLIKQEESKQAKKQLKKKAQNNKQPKSHALVAMVQKLQKAKKYQDQIKQSSIICQNKIVVQQQAGFTVFPQKLKTITRWCKICKNSQSLRVRHCHQCNKCVSNFDHHCPWINNCIGQKNKLKLIIYIVLQNIQLFYLIISIEKHIQGNMYKHELIFLWLVVILLAIMVTSMLLFQLFLITRNISTWEHIRWNKIEYLKIFNQKKLKSLFNRGFTSNLAIFFKANCSKAQINWINYISPQAHNSLVEGSSDTDRRISK